MDPRRILVVQLRRIGDVVLTTPAVAALQRRFPGARIDFLVEPPSAEVVKTCCSGINEVLVYSPKNLVETLAWLSRIRSRNYDLVVDFMGNPRTALLAYCSDAPYRAGPAHVFHRWAYNIRLPQSTQTFYAAREKIRMLAPLGVPDQLMPLPRWPRPLVKQEGLIGLMPASRKETRRWPAEHYAALGRMFRDKLGEKIIVFWGPGEYELAAKVAEMIGQGATLCGETKTLRQLAEEVARCRLIITNCAGPKHIAVALDVPTLTIHSSSDPKAWTPLTERHRAIRRDELHCIGCMKNECPYKLECLRDLSPERVFAAARSMPQAVGA